MKLQVRTPQEASEALSYFNHFHDGFVESILVQVIPESREGFGFALPVRYDVTLSFVHENYERAGHSGRGTQRIEMRLLRAKEIRIGNMVPVDNMIQECTIEVDASGDIQLDVDGLLTFVAEALSIEEKEA